MPASGMEHEETAQIIASWGLKCVVRWEVEAGWFGSLHCRDPKPTASLCSSWHRCHPGAWTSSKNLGLLWGLASTPGRQEPSQGRGKPAGNLHAQNQQLLPWARGEARWFHLLWLNQLELHPSSSPSNEVGIGRIVQQSHKKLPELERSPSLVGRSFPVCSDLLLDVSCWEGETSCF